MGWCRRGAETGTAVRDAPPSTSEGLGQGRIDTPLGEHVGGIGSGDCRTRGPDDGRVAFGNQPKALLRYTVLPACAVTRRVKSG
jgi:hypothetical protein